MLRTIPLARILPALLVALTVAGSAPGVDRYPGFRGDGTGRSAAKNLPLTWTPATVAWQEKLPGSGQSSPVVFGNRIFVTAIDGPNKEKNLVVALDATTGKRLWVKELPASQTVKVSFSVSQAAPTPVVDANALYVFFESGELAALDHAGKVLWLRSLVKEYGAFQNGHGLGGSPAQTSDTVFVLIDHQGPSYLLAVDKKTGKNRWKTERTSRASWTSPVVVRQGEKDFLVLSSGGSVDVYDAKTGKQLSTYTDVTGNNVPSAVAQDGRVVIGATDSQRNPNREQTLKSCCCLALSADGKLSAKPLWHSEKATSSFASPLIHQGCVYYLNSVGVVSCLDLKTGKEHYAERIGSSCWASPVGAGDRVYLFARDGTTTVLAAGPKFKRLATNTLWAAPAAGAGKEKPGMGRFSGPIVYGAALVDGAIYLRTGNTLYAVRSGEKANPATR